MTTITKIPCVAFLIFFFRSRFMVTLKILLNLKKPQMVFFLDDLAIGIKKPNKTWTISSGVGGLEK